MTPLITTARTWIGTPFHHQGRLKHIGCDCLGLVLGIAEELALQSEGTILHSLDNTAYSRAPNTTELIQKMERYLQKVEAGKWQAGDIALIHIAGNPQHLGIITDGIHGSYGILHAVYGKGVVEHGLTVSWRKRIYRVYRFSIEENQ